MDNNCFAHDPKKDKCCVLTNNKNCGTGCPFYKTPEKVDADRRDSEKRLALLPEDQQKLIADTYYRGRRVWGG